VQRDGTNRSPSRSARQFPIFRERSRVSKEGSKCTDEDAPNNNGGPRFQTSMATSTQPDSLETYRIAILNWRKAMTGDVELFDTRLASNRSPNDARNSNAKCITQEAVYREMHMICWCLLLGRAHRRPLLRPNSRALCRHGRLHLRCCEQEALQISVA